MIRSTNMHTVEAKNQLKNIEQKVEIVILMYRFNILNFLWTMIKDLKKFDK